MTYTRVLTKNDDYRPQQILMFGNPLDPTCDFEFWNPVSGMDRPSSYLSERLPVLSTCVETTAK